MLRNRKQIRCWIILPLVLFAAMHLAGCAEIPDYPSQYPPLVPMIENTDPRLPADRIINPYDMKCVELSGRYSDQGTAITPKGKSLGQVSLTQILHGKDLSSKSIMAADAVVIIGPKQEILQIQSWKGNEKLRPGSCPHSSL